MEPMLVPAMQCTGTRSSSSTLRTPICAAPRAPPPESTRQMRGDAAGGAEGAVCAEDSAVAASSDSARAKRAARFLIAAPERSEASLQVGEVAVHAPAQVTL